MQTILHWPYEGTVLQQPAKVVDFFNKIQLYISESQDDDSDSVDEVDPEKEASDFTKRQRMLNNG